MALKVVYFKTDEDSPRAVEIPHTLSAMQELVGGLLEVVSADMFGNDDPRLKDLDIWINEEGKIYGLTTNIIINPDSNNYFWESLCGDLFVAAHSDEGETLSIPDDRIESVIKALLELRRAI